MANPSGNGETTSTLNIFERLEEAQSSHGIPIGDYAQYHAYCTKKLDRLRHNKAVRSQLVHNHKYVEGVSGRRHAYCPRIKKISNVDGDAEGIETDSPEAIATIHENVFLNLLFQAERAWAQGCALQQQKPQPLLASGKSKKQSNHAYVQRRLNKAAKWAKEFHQTVVSNCTISAESVKESQAYAAWMEGNAALEHKQHVTAYRQYKLIHDNVLELAHSVSEQNSAEALAVRDLWTSRAETTLRPLMRYCQYEAKDELTAQDLIEATVSATTKYDTSSSSSIVLNFRGQDIALDACKVIAVLYLKMESSLKQPESLDEGQSLQLLTDLDDAIQMVAAEMKQYEAVVSKSGPAIAAKLASLSSVQAYFRYQKLSIWRRQQEKLVVELSNDAEIVHVYNTLQQNAIQMAELPSASTDLEEDDPLSLEAQAHVVRIRAFRCYYLARLYESSTLNGTSQQVLALLQQSHKLCKRAIEEIGACDTIAAAEAAGYLNALDDLSLKIKAMTCRVEATQYLQSSSSSSSPLSPTSGSTLSAATDRPLWMRLDEWDAGTVLADDPPLLIPMPCKGVFYDIAWQYVAAPVSTTVLEEYIAEHEPTKSRFLGWF